MKLLFPKILLLTLLLSQASAQITFEKDGWQAALAKARQQNKPIFLDIYASWCGPCKMLEKNVYSRPEVGEYMNKNFINVKLDGEEGEGIDLQNQFAVSSYPTLIFVKPSGDRFYSFIGYREPADFLEEAKNAVKEATKPTVSDFAAQFEKGKRDKAFLADYLDALIADNTEQIGAGTAVDAYVTQLSAADTGSEGVVRRLWNILPSVKLGSPAFQYLMKNLETFKKSNPYDEENTLSTQELRRSVESYVAYYEAKRAIETKNLTTFTNAVNGFKQIIGSGTKWFSEPVATVRVLEREFYERTGDKPRLLTIYGVEAEEAMAKLQEAAGKTAASDSAAAGDINYGDVLNTAAAFYAANATDPRQLEQAARWVKKSLEYSEEAGYADTQAKVFIALNKYPEALEAQRRAVRLAYEYGEAPISYWRNLFKIKEEIWEETEHPDFKPTVDNLKLQVEQYLSLVRAKKVDEFMDYLPTKLFDFSSEEELADIFYNTYYSTQLPMQMTHAKVNHTAPVFVHEGTAYALVDYSTTLSLDIAAIEAAKVPNFLSDLRSTYGDKNVMHDTSTNHVVIQSTLQMFGIAEAQRGGWKFVNREGNAPNILDALVPTAVQQHFR